MNFINNTHGDNGANNVPAGANGKNNIFFNDIEMENLFTEKRKTNWEIMKMKHYIGKVRNSGWYENNKENYEDDLDTLDFLTNELKEINFKINVAKGTRKYKHFIKNENKILLRERNKTLLIKNRAIKYNVEHCKNKNQYKKAINYCIKKIQLPENLNINAKCMYKRNDIKSIREAPINLKNRIVLFNVLYKYTYEGKKSFKWATMAFNHKDLYVNNNLQYYIFETAVAKILSSNGGDEYAGPEPYSYEGIERFENHVIRERDLSKIKFKRVNLGIKFLEQIQDVSDVSTDNNECVLRYIINRLSGKDNFKNFNMKELKQQLKQLRINYDEGLSVQEIIRWIRQYYPKSLSLYAINPLNSVFDKYVAPSGDQTYILSFICNNEHIYGIHNEEILKSISKSKRLDTEGIDYKFNYSSSNYEYIKMYEDQDEKLNDDDDINTIIQLNKTERYKQLINGELSKDMVYILDDVMQCATDIMKVSNYTITMLKIKKSAIVSFIDPRNNCIIEDGGYTFNERKKLNDKLYQMYPCANFTFKNQSITTMINNLFEINFDKIDKLYSSYTEEQMNIIDTFSTIPLIQTNHKNINVNLYHDQGYDIKRSYTNAILNMKQDYPLFNIMDDFKEYTGEEICLGEYLIDNVIIKPYNLKIKKQIISADYAKYLLDNKYINTTDILLVRKASGFLSCNKLKLMVKFILKKFKGDEWNDMTKQMINYFIGSFGKRYNQTDQGFITTDINMLLCMFYKCNEENKYFSFNRMNDLFFCRINERKRLNSDASSINRTIISRGQIQLIELLKTVWEDGKCKMIGCNTDSVFIRYKDKLDAEKHMNKIINKYKDVYRLEEWKPKLYNPFEWNNEEHIIIKKDMVKLNDIQFNGENFIINGIDTIKEDGLKYIEELKTKSFLCTGSGGSQKSTLICSLYDDKCLIMSNTNNAVELLKDKLGKDANVYTFDSKILTDGKFKINDDSILKGINRIIIDECSMTSLKYYIKLYELVKRNNLIFQCFGDMKQLPAIEDNMGFIDYTKKRAFLEMVNYHVMEKQYNVKTSRYIENLHNTLEYVNENNKLPEYLSYKKITNPLLENNFCYTNKKRREINNLIIKSLNRKDLIKKQYFIGMRVVSNVNFMKMIFNSRIYYIAGFENNYWLLSETPDLKIITFKNKSGEMENLKVPYETMAYGENKLSIEPAYCMTIHKAQGKTIEGDYNIYEIEKFSCVNMLTTALGRGRDLDKVHFNYTNKVLDKLSEDLTPREIILRQAKLGKVYKIVNDDAKLYYIGTTRYTIKARLAEHRKDKNSAIYKTGIKKGWTIEELTSFYYHEPAELFKLEEQHIKTHKHKDYELLNIINNEVKLRIIKPVKVDKAILKKYEVKEHDGYYRIHIRNGPDIKRKFNDGNKDIVLNGMNEILQKYILSLDE